MGYICHHAIIVTCYDLERLQVAHGMAAQLITEQELSPAMLSPITGPTINGYRSFLVGPDGSKEGWDHSDRGDEFRAMFVAWLDSQRYEDGSTWISWVEVLYGDDNDRCEVVNDDGAFYRARDSFKGDTTAGA